MIPADFRKELKKIMPGYKWTVHKKLFSGFIEATGTQSAGLNRTSTLRVEKRKDGDESSYTVKSAGFGKSAPWLSKYTDGTLARALRGLQEHYEDMAQNYADHAAKLQKGRKQKEEK